MALRVSITALILGGLLLSEGYAQEKKARTPEFHLKRAKRDRTIGLIAGAAAAAGLVTGIIYDNKDGEGIGETLGNGNIAVLGYGSAVTFGLTGVGFFIGSGYHKRKAASIRPIAYADRLLPHPTGARMPHRTLHAGVAISF